MCRYSFYFSHMQPITTFPQGIVGIPMNILAILVLTMAVNTWGKAIFDLDNVPAIFTSGSLEGVCRAVVMTTLDPNSTTTSLSTTP